jgi:hypothetical protein
MDTQGTRRAARWSSGGLALVGVLLLLPSFVEPTRTMSVSDRERGALLKTEFDWRWGRVRVTGVENVELQDTWSWLGLVVFGLLAAGATVCVVLWLLHRPLASAAAPAGGGLLAGSALTTVASRVNASLTEVDQGVAGLTVRTQMTLPGTLETASVVVLLGAVVAMVLTSRLDRAEVPAAHEEPQPGRTPGRVLPGRPVAVERGALRPAGEHLSGPPVELVEDDRG